eukprot:CAMPEP_0194588992 /NCGR_PEP_ID=MMETSP0292-20121207/20253_1 /TAXON_ID=39354 /ORGANISM="Heterosigma akashiwo, Strain CCMP2393" /LENGTH=61 /DNA_ID=CAMNT_0039445887 /DNA_START=131 /DNA_END=316 /DNA_ORIENTATION=+
MTNSCFANAAGAAVIIAPPTTMTTTTAMTRKKLLHERRCETGEEIMSGASNATYTVQQMEA